MIHNTSRSGSFGFKVMTIRSHFFFCSLSSNFLVIRGNRTMDLWGSFPTFFFFLQPSFSLWREPNFARTKFSGLWRPRHRADMCCGKYLLPGKVCSNRALNPLDPTTSVLARKVSRAGYRGQKGSSEQQVRLPAGQARSRQGKKKVEVRCTFFCPLVVN